MKLYIGRDVLSLFKNCHNILKLLSLRHQLKAMQEMSLKVLKLLIIFSSDSMRLG